MFKNFGKKVLTILKTPYIMNLSKLYKCLFALWRMGKGVRRKVIKMKKLLALCLTVMLVVAMVPAFAVSAADAATINVGSAQGYAGDTVTVDVALANNPGIVSMKLSIAYDAAVLELTNKAAGAFSPLNYSQTMDANPYIANWVDSINPDRQDNATFVTLTFKIKDDAAVGKTDITVTYNPDDVYNSAYDNVAFEVVNGTVDVLCKHAETEVTKEAVAPTCTEAGSTAEVSCKACGEVIEASVEVAALGHDTEIVDAKDHTADEDGYTGDEKCKTCGEVVKAGVVIPAGHVWKEVEEKAATCTEDGVKGHFECELCDAIAADENGTEAGDLKIEATGHKFVNGECACGEKEAVEEEKPADKPADTTKPADKPANTDKGDKAPQTNDFANILVVVSMLVAAAAATVVVLKKKA